MNQAWLLNFVCFTAQYACRFNIYSLLPSAVQVVDSEFIEFLPAVRFRKSQMAIQAMATFLNWFGMIAVLSYSPNFSVMGNTLARSAKELAGFAVIFFIVFFGFAQSYAIVFHGRIKAFRTTMQSMFALIRGLLGDFDFVEMQENAPFMGTQYLVHQYLVHPC